MHFEQSNSFTVGAEWELQLLDESTLDLAPGIESVMGSFAGDNHVNPEFIQSCVEVNTPVCNDSNEVEVNLASTARTLLDYCKSHGMRLAGAGTHPFCRRLALITPLPRYLGLAEKHGHLAQTQLAFATHVHVGMASGDDAIRAMRLLTPVLPILIALAANSPFWRNYETGFASYRRRLLAASRSYGLPPYFSDWSDFSQFFDMATHAGAFHSIKDIHWDIRPHPDIGTLEFRVMDSQTAVQEVAMLAGAIRTLVVWVSENSDDCVESVLPKHLSNWVDRENHFRASHWGIEAKLIVSEEGKTRRIGDVLDAILDATSEVASRIGEQGAMIRFEQACEGSAGYLAQLNAIADADTVEVARFLANSFDESIGAN